CGLGLGDDGREQVELRRRGHRERVELERRLPAVARRHRPPPGNPPPLPGPPRRPAPPPAARRACATARETASAIPASSRRYVAAKPHCPRTSTRRPRPSESSYASSPGPSFSASTSSCVLWTTRTSP